MIRLKFQSSVFIVFLFFFTNTHAGELEYAEVKGNLCYPSDYIPSMTIYAKNITTAKTYAIHTKENAKQYIIKLPAPSAYIFFSWINKDEQKIEAGGIYSMFSIEGNIACEAKGISPESEECLLSHMPVSVPLKANQKLSGIDICDYYYPFEDAEKYVPKP